MGAKIILNSRTPSDLEEVASEIRANGGEAESVVFDVSDMAQVATGAQAALDVWGRVDIPRQQTQVRTVRNPRLS